MDPGHLGARLLVAGLLSATLAGCQHALEPLPLRPEPIPYADTLPIEEPEPTTDNRWLRVMVEHVPHELAEPVGNAEGEALNLTHFDDVVGSAWFEPRMGYRDISPEELARGPTSPERGPAPTGTLVVTEGKSAGATPGFTVRDERGVRYIVKFDPIDYPHLTTAAGVTGNRLMWGMGYHVPEDYLLVFDSTRLRVGDDATIVTVRGERPMDETDVARVLRKTRALPDGRYVALASRFVPGIPKGTTPFAGRRDDDPNDHYRREYRRELRALRVLSSWIHNPDIRQENTPDVYVEPGYLRHYLIDFGLALGSRTDRPKHPKDGAEQPLDPYWIVGRILTLGLYDRAWEEADTAVIHPSVGYFPAEDFDPEGWEFTWDIAPTSSETPADAYWGAKIVAAFSDEHIRAAVRAGGLPEPWMVDTLTSILAARRDRLVRHWYGIATPVEEPRVRSSTPGSLTLAFRDLGLETRNWSAGETRYAWTFRHEALGRTGEGVTSGSPSGSGSPRASGGVEVEVGWTGRRDPEGGLSDEDSLATLRLRTLRPGIESRPATVWLRWREGRYEVVGLEH